METPTDIAFGMTGPPCADMTIKNNRKVALSTCVALGQGKSGSGVHMTAEFMEKYKPLVMIVEMVFGANVKYQGSIETNLDAMEKSFIEKGFSVQSLSARADAVIPQMRNRFYIVCVHCEAYAFMHRGHSDSIAFPVAMHNLKSLWEDRLCCI